MITEEESILLMWVCLFGEFYVGVSHRSRGGGSQWEVAKDKGIVIYNLL